MTAPSNSPGAELLPPDVSYYARHVMNSARVEHIIGVENIMRNYAQLYAAYAIAKLENERTPQEQTQ